MSSASERARWGLGLQGTPGLGISLGATGQAGEWNEPLAWVERAEDLGLHSVWVPEMHFVAGGVASPLLSLAAFAARSKTLRLGTTSLLLPIHEPRRLAREIAALDRLSQGRVILGLGRGFRAPLFSGFGVDAKSKRDRFDEALEEMRDEWRSGAPALDPHPPLAVAAFGPKGLRQAARHGLPYLASPVESEDQIAENLARHAEDLPAGTLASELVRPLMRTVHVAADEGEAARVCGALEAEAGALRGRVPKAIARAAEANIEERVIVGTAERVQERLQASRERLGWDLLIARPQTSGARAEERIASLERLAGEIWPALSLPATS